MTSVFSKRTAIRSVAAALPILKVNGGLGCSSGGALA